MGVEEPVCLQRVTLPSAGEPHAQKTTSLTHHAEKLNKQHLCVQGSNRLPRAATPHTSTHTYTHTLLEQSVLTRVSGGIKEALRAKQQSSTCFLKKRKQKRQGTLFSNDSRSLRGNVHRITEQAF